MGVMSPRRIRSLSGVKRFWAFPGLTRSGHRDAFAERELRNMAKAAPITPA